MGGTRFLGLQWRLFGWDLRWPRETEFCSVLRAFATPLFCVDSAGGVLTAGFFFCNECRKSFLWAEMLEDIGEEGPPVLGPWLTEAVDRFT